MGVGSGHDDFSGGVWPPAASPAASTAATALAAALALFLGWRRSFFNGRSLSLGILGHGSGGRQRLLLLGPAASSASSSTSAATAAPALGLLGFLLLWLCSGRLGNRRLRGLWRSLFFFPCFLRVLWLRYRLGGDFFLFDHIEWSRRRSDLFAFGEQLHLALLDRILGAVHVKDVLALIAIGGTGHDRLRALLLRAMALMLVAALLIAPAMSPALVTLIAALVTAIAALLVLRGLDGRDGWQSGRHAKLLQEDQAIARVEQLEVHRIHAEVGIGADDNPLARMLLEIGQ